MNYQILNAKKGSQSGFTLVELSIVLVIIGLIIGGVLVGQDLIKAAETRSQLRQFDEINTALNTFRLKYNALPGDYNAAVVNLGATAGAGTGNGDGDSILEDSDGATGGYADLGNAELLAFWHHMGLSGLLSGGGSGSGTVVGTTWPKAKIGNLGVVAFFSTTLGTAATGGGQHFYQMGKAGGGAATFATFLTPQQAEEIDQKIDNGLPVSGSVNARGGATIDAAGVWSNATGTAADCVDGGAAFATATAYNSDAGIGGVCNLRIKMSF